MANTYNVGDRVVLTDEYGGIPEGTRGTVLKLDDGYWAGRPYVMFDGDDDNEGQDAHPYTEILELVSVAPETPQEPDRGAFVVGLVDSSGQAFNKTHTSITEAKQDVENLFSLLRDDSRPFIRSIVIKRENF